MDSAELSVAVICESLARITHGYYNIKHMYTGTERWLLRIYDTIVKVNPDLSEYASKKAVEVTDVMDGIVDEIDRFQRDLRHTTEALFVLYDEVWGRDPEYSFTRKLESVLVTDILSGIQDAKHDMLVLPEYNVIIKHFVDNPDTQEYFEKLQKRLIVFANRSDELDKKILNLMKLVDKTLNPKTYR